jgi:hypothetical protein
MVLTAKYGTAFVYQAHTQLIIFGAGQSWGLLSISGSQSRRNKLNNIISAKAVRCALFYFILFCVVL